MLIPLLTQPPGPAGPPVYTAGYGLFALDPGELSELRAELAGYMDQVAQVMRSSASGVTPIAGQTVSDGRGGIISDSRGGLVDTYSLQVTYACRLAERFRPPQEIVAGASPVSVSRFVVSLPFDADVRFRDQLVIGGNTYRVEGVNAGVSDALCVTAECERVS